MTTTRKFTKPSTPLTEAIWKKINAKTYSLVKTFKDFANEDKRKRRIDDLNGRFAGAVMKAYAKFIDNDTCSFESYAEIFLDSELKHCIRDYAREIERERQTLSLDVKISDEGEGETVTFADVLPDSRDMLSESLDRSDINEAIVIVRMRDRRWAKALELFLLGYKLNEIAEELRITEREFYRVVWPAAKAAMRNVLEFRR